MKKLVCLLVSLLLFSSAIATEQIGYKSMPILQTSKVDYQQPYWVKVDNAISLDINSFMMTDEECCNMSLYVDRKQSGVKRGWRRKAVGAIIDVNMNLVAKKMKGKELKQVDKEKNILCTEKIKNKGYTSLGIFKNVPSYINRLVLELEINSTGDPDWLQIFEKTWIRKNTIKFNKNTVSFWEKTLNSNDLNLPDIYGQKVWYAMQHDTIDCYNKTYIQGELAVYNTKGHLIIQDENNYNKTRILPDTKGEYMYNYFCSAILK